MDIELARTFLAIVAAGSFVRAAERLNVSQTTVSARIRSLEEQLRRPLFVRNKAGASLTPAGESFLRHAPSLVQLWERARHEVAVPQGRRARQQLRHWRNLMLPGASVTWAARQSAAAGLSSAAISRMRPRVGARSWQRQHRHGRHGV